MIKSIKNMAKIAWNACFKPLPAAVHEIRVIEAGASLARILLESGQVKDGKVRCIRTTGRHVGQVAVVFPIPRSSTNFKVLKDGSPAHRTFSADNLVIHLDVSTHGPISISDRGDTQTYGGYGYFYYSNGINVNGFRMNTVAAEGVNQIACGYDETVAGFLRDKAKLVLDMITEANNRLKNTPCGPDASKATALQGPL